MESFATAKAKALPEGVAAPVPARPVPTVQIKAVMVAAEYKQLDMLDIARRRRAKQPVEHGRGLRLIGEQRTPGGQRNRRRRCQNEFSHQLLLWISPNPRWIFPGASSAQRMSRRQVPDSRAVELAHGPFGQR
jgi:hypothetical protein